MPDFLFASLRMAEAFFSAAVLLQKPQFGKYRKNLRKISLKIIENAHGQLFFLAFLEMVYFITGCYNTVIVNVYAN